MLVLSRKIGERIVIGEDIVISVLGLHGSRVRLGVTAPQEVSIQREELHDRLRENDRLPTGHPAIKAK